MKENQPAEASGEGLARLDLMNLHDAFLNASLARDLMYKVPLEEDPERFHISDKARLERMWVAFLAVLVESWHSEHMSEARKYIKARTNTNIVTALLRHGRRNRFIDKMVATRHYMFHRDKRTYSDPGRWGPVGNLVYHENLHRAFGRALREALTVEQHA